MKVSIHVNSQHLSQMVSQISRTYDFDCKFMEKRCGLSASLYGNSRALLLQTEQTLLSGTCRLHTRRRHTAASLATTQATSTSGQHKSLYKCEPWPKQLTPLRYQTKVYVTLGWIRPHLRPQHQRLQRRRGPLRSQSKHGSFRTSPKKGQTSSICPPPTTGTPTEIWWAQSTLCL